MAGQKSIDLECKRLTEIPDDVLSLTSAHMINLRHNKIKTLPPGFGLCFQATLKRLWLWRNQFTEFPEVVLQLSNLEILDLRENFICTLPPNISVLQKLQKLWLCENKLDSLPDSICDMENLTELMAHRNNLTTLPFGFGRLKLKHLNLDENPLIQPPLEVCNEGISAIAAYQKELEEAKMTVAVPPRLKIVVLGKLMAGKTSLVAALTRAVSRLTKEEARTHCMEVKEWVLNDSELSHITGATGNIKIQEFVFEVYDVGGHDTYHTVLPFFITAHALQLLIVDLSEYQTEDFEIAVGYWIRTVSARAPGATVCVVGTKTDKLESQEQVDRVHNKLRHDINQMLDAERSQLRQEIEHLKKILEEPFDDNSSTDVNVLSDAKRSSVRERLALLRSMENLQPKIVLQNTVSSSDELQGIAQLKNTILSFATDQQLFPNVRCSIPKCWDLLLGLFESARATNSGNSDNAVPRICLPFDQVREMGKTVSLSGENLNSALSYLHETGRILHYKDSPSLRKHVFHNPAALIQVLRAVQHHDVAQLFDPSHSGFDYLSNSGLQKARENLDKHGLVRTKELKVMLRDHVRTETEVHAVLSLVERFGLCYRLGTEEMTDSIDRPTEWYRFPRPSTWVDYNSWSEDVPEGVEELQIGCRVLGSFPTGLFQRLCSNAHKFLQYRWDRADRVLGSTGTRLVHLQHRGDKRTSHDHITMATRGQAEDASDLWAAVLQVQHELELLMAEYPAVVSDFYVTCHYCLRAGVEEPHRFPGTVMRRPHAVDIGTVECPVADHGQVNAALVLPPHECDVHVSGLDGSRQAAHYVTNINTTQNYNACQFGNNNQLIQSPCPENDE
ncbi:MFHAS1 [Branchiostoma lanceolatum]|uniref:MFHAS1 protein n=1 Tax=Branchiostoma lanceolatum TaxID=7740 RepID=A0A8K0ABK4_BRALA|nr:MFHAS1 [Branchiostoma lanceolatum]